MLTLPDAILAVLVPFATLFTSPTWRKAQLLLVGAILTPGQRTVAAALRVMGRSDDDNYARYHEVLNRAVWSSRGAARILLALLLQHLDQGDGPLIFGIDETLERRRGAKIRARAIYRDPVRSSRSQLVKASGLRWQLEVTFQEVRTHLGVETQRRAAWYDKPSPTFVDAIALVRRHLWLASEGFSLSIADPDTQELPVALYHRMVDSLAYAA